MKTLALLFLAALAAPAQIVVAHSASRLQPLSPETGLAPGSLFDIYIEGLYHENLIAPEDRVTPRFRAPGTSAAVDLPVLASQSFLGRPTSFTVLAPAGIPSGQAEVVVAAGAGKNFTTPVWISESNFGLFTDAAQVWRGGPEGMRLGTPVLPGEWVTLWGTGLGAAEPPAVSVNVAGISVAPSYTGPAPGQPGLDQINFQFPAGAPEDCYIPVSVAIAGGRASNVMAMPAAAAPGPCRHRLGLSPEELATLDAGGQIPVSQIWTHSDVVMRPDNPSRYGRYDSVSLDVFRRDAAGVRAVTGIRDSETPPAGCTLSTGGGAGAVVIAGRPFDTGRPVLAGPAGRRWTMEGEFLVFQAMLSNTEETYPLASIPPSTFMPGEWAVEAPAGADIGAFRVPLRLAPPLRWLNRAALPALGRTDLTLVWDPAGYTDRERVRAGLARGLNGITCEAPATAGSVTIPARLIAQLPPKTRGFALASLLLMPENLTPSLYSLPLKDGGAVRGMATFSYLEAVTVTWE